MVNHTGVSEQQVGNDVTDKKRMFRHACIDLGPDNFLDRNTVDLAFLATRKSPYTGHSLPETIRVETRSNSHRYKHFWLTIMSDTHDNIFNTRNISVKYLGRHSLTSGHIGLVVTVNTEGRGGMVRQPSPRRMESLIRKG